MSDTNFFDTSNSPGIGTNGDMQTPPPRDNSGLLAMVEEERQTLARAKWDPASPWHNAPDLVAERERYLSSLLIRAGIDEPPVETPRSKAEYDFQEKWAEPVNTNFSDMLAQERDREAALTPTQRAEHVAALRKEFGRDYDRLLADARLALQPGSELSPAMTSSRAVLLEMAATGRFKAAKAREWAAMRQSN